MEILYLFIILKSRQWRVLDYLNANGFSDVDACVPGLRPSKLFCIRKLTAIKTWLELHFLQYQQVK